MIIGSLFRRSRGRESFMGVREPALTSGGRCKKAQGEGAWK